MKHPNKNSEERSYVLIARGLGNLATDASGKGKFITSK